MEELQRKLQARLKLQQESEGGEGGTTIPEPAEETKRASAPGRLNIPGGAGRFNPAAMGGVPSPFAMAGGGPMGFPRPHSMGAKMQSANQSETLLEPLPAKAHGPQGRRKPTKIGGKPTGS